MTVRSARASTEPGVQAGRTDTLLALFTLAVVATSLLAGGCAKGSLPPSGVPAAPAPAPAPVLVSAAPSAWRIETPSESAGYVLESRAVVGSRADSLARTDTIDTRTVLRVVPRGAAIDVTISAYEVQPRSGPIHALATAVRAVGRFDAAGAVAFEGAGGATCASMVSIAFEATRDLWVKWPAQLRIGDQWSDSASLAICRDSVPLQLILVRRYGVVGTAEDASGRLLLIERRSTMTLRGRGSIRGDSTTLAGEGSGSAMLRLSIARGWVIDGHATSVLRLTARGTRRTQMVEQYLALSIRQPGDSARSP